MKIVVLPKDFKKNGFTYNQVIRGPKKAIYSQSHGNMLIAYEVLKIKIRPQRFNTFLKRVEPEGEIYPTKELWGIAAWTCDVG
jgi:hypothetical protein